MPPTTTPGSSPSPSDEEDLAAMPGFSPMTSRGPDPLDPGATTSSPTSSDDDDPGDWADADVEVGPPGTSPTAGGPSRASIDPADLEGITRTLVGMASLIVRWVRARRRPGMHPAVWIATEEQQAAIGDPLARIAARHAPIGGEGSADVVDAMETMVATTDYVVTHLPLEGTPWEEPTDEDPDAAAQP